MGKSVDSNSLFGLIAAMVAITCTQRCYNAAIYPR